MTRVVTPGTVTEDELLDPARPNHLVALVVGRSCYGVAWVDATTVTLTAGQHTVTISKRENGARLDAIRLKPAP